MKDTQPSRIALVQQLEAALTLADELHQPITAYLIERAIDEARSGANGGLPLVGDFKRTKNDPLVNLYLRRALFDSIGQ